MDIFKLHIQVASNIILLVKDKCKETTDEIETTIITDMSREKAKRKITITIRCNTTTKSC